MKKLTISALMIIGLLSVSDLVAQSKIEVTIKNVKESKGTIRVALFNNENDFLKQPLDSKVVKASATETNIVFDNLKPGEYAMSVIHDVNENKELDKGFMGIPKEPYGFSNDARGKFGPPSYEESKLTVKGDLKTSIKVE
jgi:uncharacterized protein (DUF2141 family)